MAMEDLAFIKGFTRMCDDGWLQGWHERNGGNLTYRMKAEEVEACKPFFKEPGEWVNSIEATLKANEDVRYGLLHIIKNLDDIEERMGEDGKTYLPADPMTCVYDVTATLNGAQVYHKQVSIVLDAAGSHTLTLDYIPVGADVRVEEIYSGASYTIHPDDTTVKGGDGTIIIPADRETWASATFRNYYDENDRGGGSWTNRYTMLEDRVDPDNVDQSEEGSADILMPTPEPEPPVQQ